MAKKGQSQKSRRTNREVEKVKKADPETSPGDQRRRRIQQRQRRIQQRQQQERREERRQRRSGEQGE